MKILVIGFGARAEELIAQFPPKLDITHMDSAPSDQNTVTGYDVVFDLNYGQGVSTPGAYDRFTGTLVVGGVCTPLVSMTAFDVLQPDTLIGMNLLPTFISREVKEWSFLNDKSRKAGKQLAAALGWTFLEVDDRVGMVTPRIILQIINEACYTLQEGTATIEDIDNAMKLGTNYPYGPFEWADRIGLDHLVDLFEALVMEDSERYKICPLLMDKYWREETFYPKT